MKCGHLRYHYDFPYFGEIAWAAMAKGWGDGEGPRAAFWGRETERVKLSRKPIYAKDPVLTSLQASAEDLNYKCMGFAAQLGISALPDRVLSVLPTEI